MSLKRILFVPDTHRPYHDKKAWALMLKAAKKFKPDIIAVLGDFGDCFAVSDHDKDPNRARNLELEVADVNVGLDELDSLGARKKKFIAGNHEYRLERYLMVRAPELFNMVKIQDLYQLKDRGWEYTEYKTTTNIGKLNLTHDIGVAGRYTAQKALDTFQHNIVTAHTHRISYIIEGNAKGEAHVSSTFGWLGDAAKADYMHRVKANRDWALGFGIGYMSGNSTVYVQPVPIVNYSCMINDVLVRL